jgi:hypothetical protein
MHKIEYEIKLNESGRPCIELSKDYEDKPEDKFFAIELARYFLQKIYSRRSVEFDKETSTNIELAINLFGQLGDEIAEILWHDMKSLGEATFILGRTYHIIVDTIEDRDNLNDKGIVQNDKIYVKQEGLKVFVTKEMKIYELKGGITNDNWEEVK